MRAKAYAVYGLPPSSPTAAGLASRWSMGAFIDMLFAWHERARVNVEAYGHSMIACSKTSASAGPMPN